MPCPTSEHHRTWHRPADGYPPRRTLDFAADLNRCSRRPSGCVHFDPQTAAAEIHQRNFGAIDQELCLALGWRPIGDAAVFRSLSAHALLGEPHRRVRDAGIYESERIAAPTR